MVDPDFQIDLFGDPVRAPSEGRGRPAFEWTLERSNRVLLAFACERSQKDAALAIGCSVPTLRKVFFRECDLRKTARLRLEMRQLERLNREAEGGSVPAEKALSEMMEKLRQRDQSRNLVKQRASKAPAKAEAKGVKEQRTDAANSVEGLFAPRSGPPTMQ